MPRAVSRAPIAAKPATGAALLTAMIIVTLVATLAGSMVWQQWRAVQVEAAERARTQSAWILSGALDWARLILREDARSGGQNGIDHLGEPWAMPLAEARLSTFLAADKDNTDDGPEPSSRAHQRRPGALQPAQPGQANRSIDPDEMLILSRAVRDGRRLGRCRDAHRHAVCEAATPASPRRGRAPSGVPAAAPPADPPLYAAIDAPARPGSASIAESLRALEPYVAHPAGSRRHAGQRQHRVARSARRGDRGSGPGDRRAPRPVAPAHAVQVVADAAGTGACAVAPAPRRTSASSSSFFEVRGRLRLGDVVLEQRSLVQRCANLDVKVLQRERVASRELGGS